MKPSATAWTRHTDKPASDSPVLNEATVRPYGPAGVGIMTAHPVGLVISVGVILIAVFALPEAAVFFIGSLAVGAVFGFFLWLRHRNRGF